MNTATQLILEKLEALSQYYAATRGSGHTTAMFTGPNADTIILATDVNHVRNLRETARHLRNDPALFPFRAVTLGSLASPGSGLRGERGPLLIDNYTMMTLVASALNAIRREADEAADCARRAERMQADADRLHEQATRTDQQHRQARNRFALRSDQARSIARKAWKKGDRKKHAKYSAVARAWKQAESTAMTLTTL